MRVECCLAKHVRTRKEIQGFHQRPQVDKIGRWERWGEKLTRILKCTKIYIKYQIVDFIFLNNGEGSSSGTNLAHVLAFSSLCSGIICDHISSVSTLRGDNVNDVNDSCVMILRGEEERGEPRESCDGDRRPRPKCISGRNSVARLLEAAISFSIFFLSIASTK